MKKLGIVILIILVLLVAVVLARNTIAKNAISAGVKAITGLDLNIGSMDVGILKSIVSIKEIKLYNPPEFSDKLMVVLPEIYVDYDLGAFLKKIVHIEEMKLNLKEFVVVKNEKGALNLDSLKVVKDKKGAPSQEEKTKKGEFKIDVLQLKIGKVIFKDYSQGKNPKTIEVKLDIDEKYENITDANKLVSLIVTKALMNTAI
ncbi:MAG: AsmA family protein, partial [Candidatus Omnitrophota bacterium]